MFIDEGVFSILLPATRRFFRQAPLAATESINCLSPAQAANINQEHLVTPGLRAGLFSSEPSALDDWFRKGSQQGTTHLKLARPVLGLLRGSLWIERRVDEFLRDALRVVVVTTTL